MIEVTKEQLGEMSNSLGLLYEKKPYRNRFQTDENDKNWNDLVEKGLAKRGVIVTNGLVWFWLTKEGVELTLGHKIRNKTYENL